MGKSNIDLSAFTSDPFMQSMHRDEVDHDAENLERLYRTLSIGNYAAKDISKAGSTVREMLNKARWEAGEANLLLIECDLNTPEGVNRAKTLQNNIFRYNKMVEWIGEFIALGNDAAADLQQHQDEDL
ncbi:MAG: hypothetical protein GY938_30985 [Ketobacter sp.]|nr:hypothetical protein [Ketobacter sp.]